MRQTVARRCQLRSDTLLVFAVAVHDARILNHRLGTNSRRLVARHAFGLMPGVRFGLYHQDNLRRDIVVGASCWLNGRHVCRNQSPPESVPVPTTIGRNPLTRGALRQSLLSLHPTTSQGSGSNRNLSPSSSLRHCGLSDRPTAHLLSVRRKRSPSWESLIRCASFFELLPVC